MAARYAHPEEVAAWRAAYDLTEQQACVVIALMAAHRLGYDGATLEELAQIGVTPNSTGRASELARMRLIEVVGYTEEKHRRKIWAATATAWRRFHEEPPVLAPVEVQTVGERAELMAEREAERKRAQSRRKSRAA